MPRAWAPNASGWLQLGGHRLADCNVGFPGSAADLFLQQQVLERLQACIPHSSLCVAAAAASAVGSRRTNAMKAHTSPRTRMNAREWGRELAVVDILPYLTRLRL